MGERKARKKQQFQSSESESDALSDVDMLTPRHTPTSSASETSHKRGKGRWKGKQKAAVVQSSESKESDALSDESDASSDVDMLAPRHSPTSSKNAGETSHPQRQWQTPSRFHCNSESEENDRTICVLCEQNDPEGLSGSIVFWIDCEKCGCWVHNICAFGNNTASRYLCMKCSSS